MYTLTASKVKKKMIFLAEQRIEHLKIVKFNPISNGLSLSLSSFDAT